MSDNVDPMEPTAAVPSEAAVFRKVSLRLLPFLFLLYVINLIDRTNIGIARLQMVDKQELLDEAAYSLGAGIFYVGYLLFEVPSNLILLRMGARAWIARMKRAIRTLGWRFSADRMVMDYVFQAYIPAAGGTSSEQRHS